MRTVPNELIILLQRIFHKMLTETRILHGYYDITLQEAWYIEENQKIPLDVIEVLAIDHYFVLERAIYKLTLKQANKISDFLSKGRLDDRYRLLKKHFVFIEKEMKNGQ